MTRLPELKFSADERIQIKKYVKQIEANIAKEEMTPLERLLTAERHKEPDRVPIHLCTMEHNSRAIKVPLREIYKDPKKAVLADLATVALYGSDVMHNYPDPHVIGTEEMGTKIDYPEDSTAILREFPVKTIDDVDRLEVPDPYADGKLPKVLQIIETESELLGDKMVIWQHLNGPFGHAGDIRGYMNLLRDMVVDPDFIHALMKFTTKATITITKAVQKAGAIAWPFDALVAAEYLGRKRYVDFVYPYHKKAMEALTPPGAYLGIDGKVHDMIEEYAATGARGICIEDVRSMDDLADFKRRVGDKTTFLSIINWTDTLLTGSKEEIEKKTREEIKILAPGGGYILGAGVVPLDGDPARVKIFMDAAKRYGKYPIRL